MLLDFHLVSLETSRPTGKEKFTLGLKMRLKMRLRMKPFDSGYVIGHSLERRVRVARLKTKEKRKRKCLRTVQLND